MELKQLLANYIWENCQGMGCVKEKKAKTQEERVGQGKDRI